MVRNPLFLFSFILLCAIGLLEQLGVAYSWFDRFVWYDVLLHYLGGAWVALVAAWAYEQFPAVRRMFPHVSMAVFAVGTVLFIGASWEWYERFIGLHLWIPDYPRDVVEDLIMDTLGAGSVVLGISLFRRKNRG